MTLGLRISLGLFMNLCTWNIYTEGWSVPAAIKIGTLEYPDKKKIQLIDNKIRLQEVNEFNLKLGFFFFFFFL
jgi:hypothetical protein